jgi:hypothetical protein
MKVFSSLMALVVLIVLSSWANLFAGPRIAGPNRKADGIVARGRVRNQIQRSWGPVFPLGPRTPFYYRPYYYNHPHAYYGHSPRSVIIFTPSTYSPYYGPVTVVTSEPYYCHMHHVGFVSRVGFLDHISGTHKIPLETADAICSDANDSCVIEGY